MSLSLRFAVSLGLFLALGRLAQAAPLPIDLRWNAPADCSSPQWVLDDVRAMLENSNASAAGDTISAEATLHRTNQGKWEVRLKTTQGDRHGERSLVAADCAEASHATALLLAFMVNPNAQLTQSAEESRPTGVPSPAASPDASTGTKSAEPPTSRTIQTPPSPHTPNLATTVPSNLSPLGTTALRDRTRLKLGLSGMLDSGNLPHPTLGGALHLGIRHDRWSLELRSAAWLKSQIASARLSSAGGNFRLYDVALVGCYRALEDGAFAGQVCAGPRLLHLTGSGYGMTEPASKSALYPGALGELALLVELTNGWTVRMAGDLQLALARPEYAIMNLDTIHRPARWSARATLGFDWMF